VRTRVRKPRTAPGADLDPEQRALFEQLRGWRRERAEREGLPAYNLLTDRQLAALVRSRPADLERLAEVEGVGTGKARLFGAELLARMEAFRAGSASGPPA
jgi:ATP-dependent DNA helicase RecQ